MYYARNTINMTITLNIKSLALAAIPAIATLIILVEMRLALSGL